MRPSSKTAERSRWPNAALVELLPLPTERLDEPTTWSIRSLCGECSWPKAWPCSKTAEPSLSPRAASVEFFPLSPERLDEQRAETVLPTRHCYPTADGVRARRQGPGRQGLQPRPPRPRGSILNLSGGFAGLSLPAVSADEPCDWLRSRQETDDGGPKPRNGYLVIEAKGRNLAAPQTCGRATRFPLAARSKAADKRSASRRPRSQAQSQSGGSARP